MKRFALVAMLVVLSRVAGAQTGTYHVWMKVSPCSAVRDEWFTVADQYPVGGLNHYIPAPQSKCVLGCTFDEAMAEAVALRGSTCDPAKATCPNFKPYCCPDWDVWKTTATGEMSITHKPMTGPGFGRTVERAHLCCEEAAAFAGLPMSLCGVGVGGGGASFLGCFHDPNNPFDLDGFLERSRTNTPDSCIKKCRARGFAYAGVQYGESCLCGNHYGQHGKASNCTMKCTGDPGKICGGYSSNSVYATGLPVPAPKGR